MSWAPHKNQQVWQRGFFQDASRDSFSFHMVFLRKRQHKTCTPLCISMRKSEKEYNLNLPFPWKSTHKSDLQLCIFRLSLVSMIGTRHAHERVAEKRQPVDSARISESEGQWRHFAFRFFVVFLFNFWQACSIYFSLLWGRERVWSGAQPSRTKSLF
jgi:hypothetical protein